jgi:hypothetical protein
MRFLRLQLLDFFGGHGDSLLPRDDGRPHDGKIAFVGAEMRAANSPTTRLSIYREHHVAEEKLAPAETECAEPRLTGRRWLAAALLATLAAAGITAACLSRGMNGPFGQQPSPGNFGFWIVVGMGVGVGFRIALKAMARFADSSPAAAESNARS